MREFWKIALSVAGIGAVAGFVFLGIYQRWLDLGIFEKLTRRQTFVLMVLFLSLTALFAIIGLVVYALRTQEPVNRATSNTGKATHSFLDRDLLKRLSDNILMEDAIILVNQHCNDYLSRQAFVKILKKSPHRGPLLSAVRLVAFQCSEWLTAGSAIETLGLIRDRESQVSLMHTALSPDPHIAKASIGALAAINPNNSQVVNLAGRILLAEASHPDVKREAISLLSLSSNPYSAQHLEQYVDNHDRTEDIITYDRARRALSQKQGEVEQDAPADG